MKYLPRVNIRLRQQKMSGRWIDTFPYDHEEIDSTLLRYKYGTEAADFIRYWENLFYEPFHEMPEVTSMMSELELNP